MSKGGIADVHRASTCREKYGCNYIISRPDIAKLASLKGNSAESRKKAVITTNKNMENYSLQLSRGLKITRSKSEVLFLSEIERIMDTKLDYQKYCSGWWIDAYCSKYDCWIQFDGVYWHSKPDAVTRDIEQNEWFAKNGKKLLRITDVEAKNKNAIMNFIDRIITSID